MDKKHWQKVKDLFEAARKISPAEREEFLDRECGGDSQLHQEVEKLLPTLMKMKPQF